ncbi:hypothetical protein QTP70_002347 [Hemibagrus guttatus]|uniref:Endonuclease/exonuclease/phosphatase domain-containing protein n=1 Tax=Hemibagrus guttatus TaxID=175788 RepID=A0AAE0RB99_9TELE|nr:hypothetical protein QTP70_002347 [Hemibagrus guttatus]
MGFMVSPSHREGLQHLGFELVADEVYVLRLLKVELKSQMSFSKCPGPTNTMCIPDVFSFKHDEIGLDFVVREEMRLAVSVTSPINLFIIVIFRPPGPLGDFLEEMDTLLNVFPSDSTPLMVLGDFNLPSDKLHSSGLLALLNSFSLSFNSCPPAHKEGNVLDLVFTHPSPATDMTATPIHISDHHLVSFTITLPILPKHTMASARISACLVDITSWMTAHQLKLNPSKTELLIIPGDPSPAQDLAISLNNSMISPLATGRNLGFPSTSEGFGHFFPHRLLSQVGRDKQELSKFLHTYCTDHLEDWSRFLPWAEYTKVHSVTHPLSVFGRIATTPFPVEYYPSTVPGGPDPSK